MGFIKKDIRGTKRHYYYCENINADGKWQQKLIRPATQEEIATINNNGDIVLMNCSNPDCDNQIKMSRNQKRRFNTTYPLRYKRFQMVYCSECCQQMHDTVLRGV